ncbi:MAG TPA: SMC family ATPase, partial [archaeon]|nr:SMC family ATPase [archaeon]
MITKVRLKNWKSHLNSEFEFTQGVNALVGIMGSGKSSVLDAISFALFGTFPNLNSKKITLDDLIMKRPQEKEEAEVEVDFSVDGKSYSVRRRIGKDKGTVEAEIREGQRLVEVNPASVTEHVERVLQIDYPLFSKAVYSEQNNIDYFLTIPKGKRMQHIDRMLRLDLFENVRECVGSIKNLFEAKVSEKIRLLSEIEKDDMETKVAELKKVMENNRDVAEKLKVSLERLELKRVEAAGKLKVAEKKVEEALRVEKNSEALKATIHEVENNLDGLKEKTMGMDKEKILSEKKLVEMQISGFRQEILKQKNLLDGRRALIAGFNTEIRLASESIKDLERLGDRCPVCESGITVEKRADLEKSRKNREEELRKNVGLLAGEVEKIKNDLESLEIELRKREREAIQIENVIGEFENIGKMVERLDGLRKQNRDMEDRKIYLELEVKDLNVERLRLDLQEIITEAARNQVDFVHLNRLVERDRESLGDFEK